ncbi:MAG: zinc ribbon domain-containing protein [Desulfobacterales bacterium]|nr:MAG: zinc ribbon domain-containing protein [Desulfobacterales bacterium]
MPIYEYRCYDCGTTSESLIGSTENEKNRCRKCGSLNLERLMSAASFVGAVHKRPAGHTCCGRQKRCETPPCSAGGACSRH